jgi:hypothetical protein
MQWFRANWTAIELWLPLVTLRDARMIPIDQRREAFEHN